MVELGISTFGETTELEGTGQTYSPAERIRQLVAQIELADKVGLDVYGIGEHHRVDFAVQSFSFKKALQTFKNIWNFP